MDKNRKYFGVYPLAVILMLIAVLLAGCTDKQAVTVSEANPGATESLSSDVMQTPVASNAIAHTYKAVDTQIIRDDGKVVYDASPYYLEDDYCGIDNLVDDGELLYFAEYGTKTDDDLAPEGPSDYAIIRIDDNGQNRQELVSKSDIGGYTGLTLFGDRLFYVDEGSDCVGIGDVSKDGKEFNMINWDAYTAKLGEYVAFGGATFTQDGNYLYVQLNIYEDELADVNREVRIDKSMKLEEMPLKEDQYLASESKLILLSKDTGEKSVFYDAADYYAEGVMISYLTETEDMLCFVESDLKPAFGEHLDSIVTLNKQSGTRNVLCSTVDNHSYEYLTIFSGQLLFVEKSIVYSSIGYISPQGSGVTYIDLPLDYQLDDVDWIDALADTLEVHMADRSDEVPQRYTLVIDKDFHFSLKES